MPWGLILACSQMRDFFWSGALGCPWPYVNVTVPELQGNLQVLPLWPKTACRGRHNSALQRLSVWFSHPKKAFKECRSDFHGFSLGLSLGTHTYTPYYTVLAHEHEGKTVRYLQPHIPFALPCISYINCVCRRSHLAWLVTKFDPFHERLLFAQTFLCYEFSLEPTRIKSFQGATKLFAFIEWYEWYEETGNWIQSRNKINDGEESLRSALYRVHESWVKAAFAKYTVL